MLEFFFFFFFTLRDPTRTGPLVPLAFEENLHCSWEKGEGEALKTDILTVQGLLYALNGIHLQIHDISRCKYIQIWREMSLLLVEVF